MSTNVVFNICEMYILLSFVIHRCALQHVFEETCTFSAVRINTTEQITLASQLLYIRNERYEVYINFCKKLDKADVPSACDQKSRVCVLKRSDPRKNRVPRPVTTFIGKNSTNVKQLLLESNDLGECDDTHFVFSVIIDKDVMDYKITEMDLCGMEITVPHPSVNFRECGYAYKGFLINMKPLGEITETFINMPNGVRTALAVCHPASACGGNSSICELSSDGKLFSVAEEQHFIYDERSNDLVLRGKKGKLRSEVLIKCNWTSTFDNATKLMGRYKYSVESKYGCVKIPHECTFKDMEHYMYDIGALNKAEGWQASGRNLSAGDILSLNVCGPLSYASRNACSDRHAQVCFRSGGQYFSYGALHSGIIQDADRFHLTYTHGSECPSHPHEYLSTTIDFVCDRQEHGPIITARVNCTLAIEWRTPSACPTKIADGTSLSFAKIQESIARTQPLSCSASRGDQVYRLSSLIAPSSYVVASKAYPGVQYFINICSPIRVNQSNHLCLVTGACVENTKELDIRKRFRWIGTIVEPNFIDNKLMMQYNGGYCENGMNYQVSIQFDCEPNQGSLTLKEESKCSTRFTWSTPYACPKKKTQRDLNCSTVTPHGARFDLSKIYQGNFKLQYRNLTYNMHLCADRVLVESSTNASLLQNASNEVVQSDNIVINSTRDLIEEKDCRFSVLYKLSNAASSVGGLCSIKVNLMCDEASNNTHFQDDILDNCDVAITLASRATCAMLTTACDRKQPEIPAHQEQMRSDLVVHEITTERPVDELHRCKIPNRNMESGQEFRIDSLSYHELTHAGNIFQVNSASCNGFVCKNNVTIANLYPCPNIEVGDGDRTEVLTFLGPTCGTGFYTVKVQIKCSMDTSRMHAEEDWCNTMLYIETNETCGLYGSQGINIIGLSAGIALSVVAIVLLGCYVYKKNLISSRCGSYGSVETQAPLNYSPSRDLND